MKDVYAVSKWAWMLTTGLYLLTLIGTLPLLSARNYEPLEFTYLTLVLGLLSQIVVGLLHIGFTIYAYMHYAKFPSVERRMLNTYSASVVVFFATWYLLEQRDSFTRVDDVNLLIMAIIIPITIGGCFVLLIKRLKQFVASKTT